MARSGKARLSWQAGFDGSCPGRAWQVFMAGTVWMVSFGIEGMVGRQGSARLSWQAWNSFTTVKFIL